MLQRMKSLSSTALALSFSLSACTFAPGMHFDRSALSSESSQDSSMIELVPITPKLLAIEAATQPSGKIPKVLLDFRPPPYRIGAGDVLQIVVWDHPELSLPGASPTSSPDGSAQPIGFLVQPDGSIYFPYIGKIHAAGLTLPEFGSALQPRLKEWVALPQVSVNALKINSAKISLSGAFERPVEQGIPQSQLTLAAALGNAGIKTADADLTSLILKRDNQEYVLDLDALNLKSSQLSGVYLRDGDHLHLPFNSRRKIYVMGEVYRPTSIAFNSRGVPLSEAISLAGGMRQETASAEAIYVVRGEETPEGKPVKVFHLDARSPVAMALASRFETKAQDVVFIGPAGVTRWNRLVTQVLPTGQIFYLGSTTANQVNTLSK